MRPEVLSEYRRLRGKGWTAQHALRSARIHAAFEDLVDAGLAKVEIEPDEMPYDASFVDEWDDIRERDRERQKKEILERVEREGHNTMCVYVRDDEDTHWVLADSVGGFIGDDWKGSGYDADLKVSVFEALGLCSDADRPCLGTERASCTHPDCVVEEVMRS